MPRSIRESNWIKSGLVAGDFEWADLPEGEGIRMNKKKDKKILTRKRIKATTIFAIFVLGIALIAALAPSVLTKYDPLEIDVRNKLAGPSAAHWLGTDEYGRDLWSRIVYGARASLSVGFGSATLAMCIGVPLGLLAGFKGGFIDSLIMRHAANVDLDESDYIRAFSGKFA